MPSALSVDLREGVVAAIEEGASRREAARRFKISPASAVRWHETFVREGRTRAKSMGSSPSLVDRGARQGGLGVVGSASQIGA